MSEIPLYLLYPVSAALSSSFLNEQMQVTGYRWNIEIQGVTELHRMWILLETAMRLGRDTCNAGQKTRLLRDCNTVGKRHHLLRNSNKFAKQRDF